MYEGRQLKKWDRYSSSELQNKEGFTTINNGNCYENKSFKLSSKFTIGRTIGSRYRVRIRSYQLRKKRIKAVTRPDASIIRKKS